MLLLLYIYFFNFKCMCDFSKHLIQIPNTIKNSSCIVKSLTFFLLAGAYREPD